MTEVGTLIQEKRKAKEMSQRLLGDIAGISHTEIRRIEEGERKQPSPKVLRSIAAALDEPYDEFMAAAGYIDKPTVTEPTEQTTVVSEWHIQDDDANHYTFTRVVDDLNDAIEVVRVDHCFAPDTMFLHTVIFLKDYTWLQLNDIAYEFGFESLYHLDGDPNEATEAIARKDNKIQRCGIWLRIREQMAALVADCLDGRKMSAEEAEELVDSIVGITKMSQKTVDFSEATW